MNTPNLRRSLSEGHLIHKTKVIRVEAKKTFSFNEPKRRKLKFQSTFSSTKQNSEKSNLLSLKAQQIMQRRKASYHHEKHKEKSCSMLFDNSLLICFNSLISVSIQVLWNTNSKYRRTVWAMLKDKQVYKLKLLNSYRGSYHLNCKKQNIGKEFIFLFRHHVPFVLYILLWLNNLVVVINSSLNFLIYCCVSESFRARTFRILGSKPCCWIKYKWILEGRHKQYIEIYSL